MATVRTTPVRISPAGRVGGWLLALSPLGFVVVVASMAGIFASAGIGAFAEITRAQMDALGAGWAIAQALVALAESIVCLGAMLVAWTFVRTQGAGRTLAGAVLGSGAAVIVLVGLGLWNGIAVASFTTPTLGEDPRWTGGVPLVLSFGLAVLQLVLLAALLWVSRARRVTGLVLGILGLVVLGVVVAAVDFVPPFVLALLACPMGISWLRGGRSAVVS